MRKTTFIGAITSVITFLFIAGSALSGDRQPLVPLPSVPDSASGSRWGLALGVEYESAYDGADEYEFKIEPAGGLHYSTGNNIFFWEGTELGWRGLVADRSLIQAWVRYEGGLEPDESKDGALDEIEEHASHLVGFIEAHRSIGNNWRNCIGRRLMGGPRDFGWLGVVAAGHRFGGQLDGTDTEVCLFSTFGTDDFINKDFGVSDADSAGSGLTHTKLGRGYRSTGITIINRRYLAKNTQFISQARAELYSSDIKGSPIAREDYELEIGFSVLWLF